MSKLVFLGINFIDGGWVISLCQSILPDIFRSKHAAFLILTTLTLSSTPMKLEKLKKVIVNGVKKAIEYAARFQGESN